MDLTDLKNPIVLFGFALASVLVGMFLLAPFCVRMSRDKNTDLNVMKIRREHNRKQQIQ